MSDRERRIDVRVGDFALSVQGFEDPIRPMKQVVRLLQRVLEETPELSRTGIDLDDDLVRELLADVSARSGLPEERLDIVPGLVVAARMEGDAVRPAEAALAASMALTESAGSARAMPAGQPQQGIFPADGNASDGGIDPDDVAGIADDTMDNTADDRAEDDAGDDDTRPHAGPTGFALRAASTSLPAMADDRHTEADPEDPASADGFTQAFAETSEPEADVADPAQAETPRLPWQHSEDDDAPDEMTDADDAASWNAEVEAAISQRAEQPMAERSRVVNIFEKPGAAPSDADEAGENVDSTRYDADTAAEVSDLIDHNANPVREESGEDSVSQEPPSTRNIFAAPSAPAPPAGAAQEIDEPPRPGASEYDGPAEPSRFTPMDEPEERAPSRVNIFARPAAPTAEPEPSAWSSSREDDEAADDGAEPEAEPGMAGERDGSRRFQALADRLRSAEAETTHSLPPDQSWRSDADGSADAPHEAPYELQSQLTPEELARRDGASTVTDLLACSAAWLTLVQGEERFARRDVMAVFDEIPGDHPRSLEARIKGYGKLVRNGVIVLVDEGQFALSEEERDRVSRLLQDG